MPSNRTWITRDEIAEIFDQRAQMIFEYAKSDDLEPGKTMYDEIKRSVDCQRQAMGFREIERLGNKTHLEEHKTMLRLCESGMRLRDTGRLRTRRLESVKLDEGQDYL